MEHKETAYIIGAGAVYHQAMRTCMAENVIMIDHKMDVIVKSTDPMPVIIKYASRYLPQPILEFPRKEKRNSKFTKPKKKRKR